MPMQPSGMSRLDETVNSLGVKAGTPAGLGYDPVVIVVGDSQAVGTTSTQDQTDAIAAYNAATTPAQRARIKVWNWADSSGGGSWVTYTPGTVTGAGFANNLPNIGIESGVALDFLATNDVDTLYIIKEAWSGSYQGVPAATAFAGYIAGNVCTPTTGTLGLPALVIKGAGVPSPLPYTLFPQTAPAYYIAAIGRTNYAGGNVGSAGAPVAMTKHNGQASWSPTEGLIYTGFGGQTTNGVKARVLAALAAITAAGGAPRIVGLVNVLGTNDASTTAATAAFGAAFDATVAAMSADWPLTNCRIVLPRLRNSGNYASIRTQQTARKSSSVMLADTDDLTIWDGTHWNYAGLKLIGQRAHNIIFKGGAGA